MWNRVILASLSLAVVLSASTAINAQPRSFQFSRQPRPMHERFNTPGNIYIADQFNHRIIEITQDHNVVWSFGSGNPRLCNPGPHTIIGPNDTERVGSFTFMAGTGVPPGVIPEMPAGCADNRVIAVDFSGHIVWQYGMAGVAGSGPNKLNVPVGDVFLPNNHVLITDQSNERVIEVTLDHKIVWQYGKTGVTGSGPGELNNPNYALLLANGHILISDENNNRVLEVTHDLKKTVVWHYGEPNNTAIVNGAAFASRLPNGNTLITSSNDARIIEVTLDKKVVWTYFTNLQMGSIAAPAPTRAVRTACGLTLISNQFDQQVIAVNHAKQIVFAQGVINRPGNTFNRLYGPYDAKVVGDYTGLTPPFDRERDNNDNVECDGSDAMRVRQP